MKAVLLALVCAAGCIVGESGPGGGGGDSTGGGDGDGTGGGNGGGGMAQPDAGTSQAACTNAVYDPCTDPAQCASGNCQLFQQAGIQVCTQTCTPNDPTTCPQQAGQPVQCNNMGICRPPAANTCTR